MWTQQCVIAAIVWTQQCVIAAIVWTQQGVWDTKRRTQNYKRKKDPYNKQTKSKNISRRYGIGNDLPWEILIESVWLWQATGELGGISRKLKPPCNRLRTAQIANGDRIWGHVRQITANGGGIHRENTKTRPDGACNKPVWGFCPLVLAAWKPDKPS